jgi:hypothetical protein
MNAISQIDQEHTPVTVALPGLVGKQRAPAFLRHGRISHYLPTESRSYEDAIRLAFWEAPQ